MINISLSSKNALQNNINSADISNDKINTNIDEGKKSSFLNLLSSLAQKASTALNASDASIKIKADTDAVLNFNNIFQNCASLELNNNIQSKTNDEDIKSSILNNEEDSDSNSQNNITEINNIINLFLLNNNQINFNKDSEAYVNNLHNKIKAELNNSEKKAELIDIKSIKFNPKSSLNDMNLDNVKINRINFSDYNQNKILSENENELLKNSDLQKNINMIFKIDDNNFSSKLHIMLNESRLKAYMQKDEALNYVKNSTDSLAKSDVEASDLYESSMKNIFSATDNLSLKEDDSGGNYDKSKTIGNEADPTLKNSSFNIDRFKEVIEITDESNKLNSSVMTQVKDKVNLMFNEKTSQATMQLNPENLGKINIKLFFGDESLKVEITAFNKDTNKILNSSVQELVAALKSNSEKPIEVIIKSEANHNDKYFNYDQANENKNNNPNNQNDQSQNHRNNKYYYDKKFADDEEKNGAFENLINGLRQVVEI